MIEREGKKVKPRRKIGPQFIPFVKEGETKKAQTSETGILQESTNWEMRV